LKWRALLLEPVLVLDAQPPRLEGSDPRGDHDGARGVVRLRGLEHEVADAVVLDPPEAGHHLAKMGARAELETLGHHVPHQVLGEHLGEAGDVEDVLLRIEREELAAESGKGIDDAGGSAAHAGIKRREQAGGPAADDRDVLDLQFRHCRSRR
jgi:hypothetical protein